MRQVKLLAIGMIAVVVASCGRPARTVTKSMIWSEEVSPAAPPPLDKQAQPVVVLRFAEDPSHGMSLLRTPQSLARLERTGNPISVTFLVWRTAAGTLGFHIAAIEGETYGPEAGQDLHAFSQGSNTIFPLERER
jgi:hypothetical protein